MQIYGAYTRGIQGHLFTVSAVPNQAGRLRVAGARDTVARDSAARVTHALKRLGIGEVGADVRLEPAGAEDPPLDTGRYSGTLDLPISLALLGMTGRLPADRLAGVVAVGGLDPSTASEGAGVRCIGAGGTTAIAHAVHSRGLPLIVAEDRPRPPASSAARRPRPRPSRSSWPCSPATGAPTRSRPGRLP